MQLVFFNLIKTALLNKQIEIDLKLGIKSALFFF